MEKVLHEISTKSLLKVAIMIGAIVLLYLIRNVLVALFVALVISASLDPLVDKLERKKIPRWVSAIFFIVVIISMIALIIFLMIPPVQEQIQQLKNNLPAIFDSYDNFKELAVKYNFIDSSQSMLATLGERLTGFTQGAVSTISGALSGIITFITVIVLSVYLVIQEDGIKRFFKSILPFKYRPYVINLVDKVQVKIGQWLRGQLILMLIIGVLTWIGLAIMGVHYSLLLAVLAGLLEIVPIIGIPIALIPAVAIAFFQSPILAVFVVLLYILIQQFENHLLVPKIMQQAVGLNPVFVILALLIGYELAGVLGVLLSVPAATAVSVFVRDFYDYRKKDTKGKNNGFREAIKESLEKSNK